MFRRLVFILLAGGLLGGCAHYRLGTAAQPNFTTLYIEPVATKLLLPQAQALVSSQIRAAFNRDGRITLVNSPEGADATLKVTLIEYGREVAALRAGDTGLARKFTLTLGVLCTLTDRRAQRSLFTDRSVKAHRDAFTDGSSGSIGGAPALSGQSQAEYQSLPLLADALAEKITHAALDVW